MIKYGETWRGCESVLTDAETAALAGRCSKSGLETACLNLIRTLLAVKDKERSEGKVQEAVVSPVSILMRLNVSGYCNRMLAGAGLQGVRVTRSRKAEIQEIRKALEKGELLLFYLRNVPGRSARFAVCWGADLVTGGEAGDRWVFYVSNGVSRQVEQLVLWDLKDASYMEVQMAE